MKDYEVGHGKPPLGTRFKRGNQHWRRRKDKRKEKEKVDFLPGREFRAVLGSTMLVNRNGKAKHEIRLQVIIERLIGAALQGDVAAANDLLSFRVDAEAAGDFQELVLVFDALVDKAI